MEITNSSFEKGVLIGEGAYSTIYRAKGNAKRVIKEYKRIHSFVNDDRIRECATLAFLSTCPYPLFAKAIGRARRGSMIVMEAFDKSLSVPGDTKTITDVMFQVLCAILYLHNRNLMHRDIKEENILMRNGSHVVLCDFGSCAFAPDRNVIDGVCTVTHRAPELFIDDREYNQGVDIWSAGVVLANMHRPRNESLFGSTDLLQTISSCFEDKNGGIDAFLRQEGFLVGPDMTDLLRKMLVVDAKQRSSIGELLRHPVFKEYKIPEPIVSDPIERVMLMDFHPPSNSIRCDDNRTSAIQTIAEFAREIDWENHHTFFAAVQLLDDYRQTKNVTVLEILSICIISTAISERCYCSYQDIHSWKYKQRHYTRQIAKIERKLKSRFLFSTEWQYATVYIRECKLSSEHEAKILRILKQSIVSPLHRTFRKLDLVRGIILFTMQFFGLACHIDRPPELVIDYVKQIYKLTI